MKSTLLYIAGVGAFLAAASAAASEDLITEKYDLSGFDRIQISGVYDLDVRVGPDFSIELTGLEYEMERVNVSVRNGVLHLDQDENRRGWRTRNDSVDAVITLPSLLGLDLSGVADVDVSGIDAETFDAALSGVGDVDLSGTCGALKASVSGVGDFGAGGLKCENVEIRVSGVGAADVFASKAVDASVSGVGSISIEGSPAQVEKSSGFLSSITIR
jgi:hypothetical protein